MCIIMVLQIGCSTQHRQENGYIHNNSTDRIKKPGQNDNGYFEMKSVTGSIFLDPNTISNGSLKLFGYQFRIRRAAALDPNTISNGSLKLFAYQFRIRRTAAYKWNPKSKIKLGFSCILNAHFAE